MSNRRVSASGRSSFSASAQLLFFGIGTLVGYIVYVVILYGISAQFLALNTFVSLTLFFSILPWNRRAISGWRSEISSYIVRYSLATFLYWYAFWIGLSSLQDASFVLAILSFTMIASPLAVRALEKRGNRTPYSVIITNFFLLFLAIVLIKLDSEFSNLSFNLIFESFGNLPHYAVACMMLAVMAEAYQDRLTYKLPKSIEEDRAKYLAAYSDIFTDHRYYFLFNNLHSSIVNRNLLPENDKIEVIKSFAGIEMMLQSLKICVVAAAAMVIIHSEWHWPYTTPWYWIIFWMLVLGICGSSAKLIFVTPLQRDGLDPNTIPPLLAGRQILYPALAIVAIFLVNYLGSDAVFVHRDGCALPSWSTMPGGPELDILPCGRFTYWLGLALAGLVWIIRWIYFWKVGFFTKRKT